MNPEAPGSKVGTAGRFDARTVRIGPYPTGSRLADTHLIDLVGDGPTVTDHPGLPPHTAGEPGLLVRVNTLASNAVDRDLARALHWGPTAIVLPGAVGRHDVAHLAAKLAVAEAEGGRPAGSTGILVQPADDAAGLLALPSLAGAGPRLRAIVWQPDALAAALGRTATPAMLAYARSMLLLTARAAGVPALHWLGHATIPDEVEAMCTGFDGGLAADPDLLAALRNIFNVAP